MASIPDKNRIILSRITLEIASAIRCAPQNMLPIDDALVAAATPVVLLNYKGMNRREMKRIMVSLERFFKRNPRFLEFTKEGVAEGLRKELLPSLDADDKVELLADFRLTPGVTEDGYVIFNPKYMAKLPANIKPDKEGYKKKPYTPSVVKPKRTPKEKEVLTTVDPEPRMSEKLKDCIAWYKQNWHELHRLEKYKWEAVEHFNDKFNIEAEDLAANLKEAFWLETNLLSGPMYMSLAMLLKNARNSPDEVRRVLAALYDESRPLWERVQQFLADFSEIHRINQAKGVIRSNERHMQSERAISVYLAFRYPHTHYLYKSSVWSDFKNEVGLDCPPLSQFPCKLFGYEHIATQIRTHLLMDAELVDLLAASERTDLSDGHLLTQDFIYCIAYHKPNWGK